MRVLDGFYFLPKTNGMVGFREWSPKGRGGAEGYVRLLERSNRTEEARRFRVEWEEMVGRLRDEFDDVGKEEI